VSQRHCCCPSKSSRTETMGVPGLQSLRVLDYFRVLLKIYLIKEFFKNPQKTTREKGVKKF
jgi:hypothetical protein